MALLAHESTAQPLYTEKSQKKNHEYYAEPNKAYLKPNRGAYHNCTHKHKTTH